MEKRSLFGGGDKDKKDNLFRKTGRGIVTVGTVVGAGILVGMGFSAFQGASENI